MFSIVSEEATYLTIKYPGYILIRGESNPNQKRHGPYLLALNPPNNVKELRHVLRMVHYRDMWAK